MYLTRRDLQLHAGIDRPLCGWDWLLGRDHPEADLTIRLTGPGFRTSTHIAPTPAGDKALRQVCKYATGR